MMTTHAMMMTAQKKTCSYIEQTPSDDFIPLAIETYGCLHFHFHLFLTACAETTIARHQQSPLVPSMLVFYYGQRTDNYTWLGFLISSTHHT
jgi:hypothetical protein